MADQNKLQHLVPDFEKKLAEEKAKAIKSALARITTEYSHFENSLMQSLQRYDELVKQGYKPIHAQHRNLGTGFNLVYEKPENILKVERQKVIDKIESEHEKKLNQLREDYIDELLSEELAEREAERLKEIESDKQLLKEKLLSTLF